MKIRYNYNKEGYGIYPRPKHATISVITFKKNKLSEQDDYLIHVMEEHSVLWLKEKQDSFESEWTSIIKNLKAQFNNRGKNIAMECLQFGGNTEFWDSFPNEEEILNYFKRCYKYAIYYIGFLSTDKNIVCAVIVTEGRRRNLFVYYLPITEKWKVKLVSNQRNENGNKLQWRDEFDNPIYNEIISRECPLLCHSEFWKRRGGLTAYSNLQEDFFQAISKDYGAKRGESKSRMKHTTPAQKERFNRCKGDDYDLFPARKSFWG